jgi:lipopolysaccharide transport system permease protein
MSYAALVGSARALIGEQLEYRELLIQMTRRDLLLRYKQTVMGVGWAVFMPLVNTIVFSLVFMRAVRVDVGMPYPLYAYTGLLAWNFVTSALRFSVTSLTGNSNLVTKVYFPREIFPFSAVIVASVDTAVGALLLVAMMAWYHVVPGPTLALLPLIAAIQFALTASLALVLAMAHLFFRDVKYLFDIVLNAGMFATAVVYPVTRMGGWPGALLALNPLSVIIDAYRAVLLQRSAPDLAALLTVGAFAAALLAVSWSAFHRAEVRFAESI